MDSSRSLIIMNKEQKERRYLEEIGIRLVGPLPMDEWPEHLFNTFQKIHSFRSYDIKAFRINALTKLKLGEAWDCETGNRAKTIAATCRALEHDNVSEMEWRLRIEELVLARFRSEIDCRKPLCQKRLWRSEIEAVVESPGVIAASLEDRRKNRQPCQCQKKQDLSNQSYIGINSMFSSRSDEMVLYNPLMKPPPKFSRAFKRRRPDRIIGFQKNGSLDRRLDPIARWVQDVAATNTIRETTECTILNSKSGPLLFPFLVIEAKSESGQAFSVCTRQTALPIWRMLKIQEALQSRSKKNLEYGGPLVWYMAYRGEAWRLYGCYITKEKDKDSYEILELWAGQLSDESGALQILLIIDYIFDWARDIYRAAINSQLEALAEEPDAGSGKAPFRAPSDNDIVSLVGSQTKLSLDIPNRTIITSELQESPQKLCPNSNLYNSTSDINTLDSGLVHGQASIPSSSNSKLAIPKSSKQSCQNAVKDGPRQKRFNETEIDRATSPSIESFDSDSNETETSTFMEAIRESASALCQKRTARDQIISPLTTNTTTAEFPPRQISVPTCTPPPTPPRISDPSPEHNSIPAVRALPKRPLSMESSDTVENAGAGTARQHRTRGAKRAKIPFSGTPPGVPVVFID